MALRETATLKADRAVKQMLLENPYFHPRAIEELRRNDAIDRVREWLLERFQALGVRFDDELVRRTNLYNETGKLGIQSVHIGLMGERGLSGLLGRTRALRKPREWQDPTIGIITPGMIDGEDVVTSVATFSVNAGQAERLTAFTDELKMDDSGDFPDGDPRYLFRQQEPLTVSGPNIVRTLLEIPKVNALQKRIRDEVHHGVYACEFLNP